jgi:nitrate reductase NapAB chaperone NapD
MPICSYLVIPAEGESAEVALRLSDIEGCDVLAAANRDLLLLVTQADTAEEDAGLRARVEAVDGIRGIVLTFGEVDPDTKERDPLGSRSKRRPMASTPLGT